MKDKYTNDFTQEDELLIEGILMSLLERVEKADKKWRESYSKLKDRKTDITQVIKDWDKFYESETSLFVFTQFHQPSRKPKPKKLN